MWGEVLLILYCLISNFKFQFHLVKNLNSIFKFAPYLSFQNFDQWINHDNTQRRRLPTQADMLNNQTLKPKEYEWFQLFWKIHNLKRKHHGPSQSWAETMILRTTYAISSWFIPVPHSVFFSEGERVLSFWIWSLIQSSFEEFEVKVANNYNFIDL